jgi:type IV secretory pathway protease TraF
MEPDLLPGDRVWFDRASYRERPPRVGEVVVLRDPDGSGRRLIKSVAAVGPSTVWVVTDGVRLAPPGPERAARTPPDLLEEVEVGLGQLFVTSRRATGTRDSRSFGPVALSLVEGEVWFRYAPIDRRGPVGPTPGSRPS